MCCAHAPDEPQCSQGWAKVASPGWTAAYSFCSYQKEVHMSILNKSGLLLEQGWKITFSGYFSSINLGYLNIVKIHDIYILHNLHIPLFQTLFPPVRLKLYSLSTS